LNNKHLDAIVARETKGLIKERPKAVLKMMCYEPKSEEWIQSFAKNCCYLVHHQDAFNALYGRGSTQKKAKTWISMIARAIQCIVKDLLWPLVWLSLLPYHCCRFTVAVVQLHTAPIPAAVAIDLLQPTITAARLSV
jgi:hypothetical protein